MSTLKLDEYYRYVENYRLGVFSSKVYKGITRRHISRVGSASVS